jgi:hypothetical protein
MDGIDDLSAQPWRPHLETVGAEIFLRYRKRLLEPGIAWEIRRDYPGLGLIDVLVRVSAGRRIIRDGDDFLVLALVRSGRWRQMLRAAGRGQATRPRRVDRLSRQLVRLGGVLVAGFCLLSLWFALTQAGDVHLVFGAAGCALLGLVLWTAAHRGGVPVKARPLRVWSGSARRAAGGERPVSARPEAPA